MTATMMTASGSRDDINGSGRRKRTGDGHLVLFCSITDGDTGLEPASYAPHIQGDKIASGYNICGWSGRLRRSQARPVSNYTGPGGSCAGELGVSR
jgi:hypothetical protein